MLWNGINHTFAGVVSDQRGWSPWLLYEARTARFTLVTTRVVLTATDETERIAWISEITAVRVAVTHTPATD